MIHKWMDSIWFHIDVRRNDFDIKIGSVKSNSYNNEHFSVGVTKNRVRFNALLNPLNSSLANAKKLKREGYFF